MFENIPCCHGYFLGLKHAELLYFLNVIHRVTEYAGESNFSDVFQLFYKRQNVVKILLNRAVKVSNNSWRITGSFNKSQALSTFQLCTSGLFKVSDFWFSPSQVIIKCCQKLYRLRLTPGCSYIYTWTIFCLSHPSQVVGLWVWNSKEANIS